MPPGITADTGQLILQNIVAGLKPVLVWMVASHIFVAIMLTMMAARTGTRGAVLAWIPVLNVFFLCMLGRRSPSLALLLLVPVVNIVVAVMIWMSVAEACGKPSLVGALVFVPGVGFLVLLYLALTARASAASNLRACTQCGQPAAPEDAFCGECGGTVAGGGEIVGRPASSSGSLALSAVGAVVLLTLLGGGTGYYLLTRAIAYTPPARQAAALPKRVAGMLREFPVDTDALAPARATSVASQSFDTVGAGAEPAVRSSWLPAGMTRSELPRIASAMVSAEYTRRGAKPNGAKGPGKKAGRAYVHVLTRREPSRPSFAELERSIAEGLGGRTTKVVVDSPSGATYEGSHIDTGSAEAYVLAKPDSDTVVVVNTPDADGREMTERLARNVGNGDGLADDPEVTAGLAALPPDPPSGFEVEAVDTTNVPTLMEEQRSTLGTTERPEFDRMLAPVRAFLPERVTLATYRDEAGHEWRTALLDYIEARPAWNLWTVLRWTAGVAMTPAGTVRESTALIAEMDDGRALVYQKGPYLVLVTGPKGAEQRRLTELGGALQI